MVDEEVSNIGYSSDDERDVPSESDSGSDNCVSVLFHISRLIGTLVDAPLRMKRVIHAESEEVR